MSVSSKMTAIADEIRELSGTSGAMGLDAMKTNLGEANDEVASQASLIAQIAKALEDKAASGITPTGTRTITENGTYDVTNYASAVVNVTTGGGTSSLSVKSGTTTNATIETGLSDIEEFFIYKESQNSAGLIRLHYSKTSGTSYMYAQTWSASSYGSKIITNSTTVSVQPTVDGGSITLPNGTTPASGGLSSGVTYKWIAVGTE